MTIRHPTAIGWYPSRADDCAQTIDRYAATAPAPPLDRPLLGGLVPHAGWRFSGRTAAATFAALARHAPAPQVVVLLGAVHAFGVDGPTACTHEAWHTPLGPLHVDRPLLEALGAARLIVTEDRAHSREHSIEVQTPLVRHLLPQATFVPVAVPPSPAAPDFGRALAAVIAADERDIAVVASSDLTHYGAAYGFTPGGEGTSGLQWARDNDLALLDRVRALDHQAVLDHARRNHSACGAGALAAAIACAVTRGARLATILERTSSHEREPQRGEVMWVGYASAVFSG